MTTGAVIDKRIPDKWRDYKPCGVPIRGQRIVAFKTPLSRSYDNHSDLDNGLKSFERFTPLDLLRHLGNTGVKLGMVVDFTNTRRYYKSMEFSSKGIKYVKLNCVGKEIPNEHIVQKFKEEVCRFFANDSTGAFVGVHCTHGLNRAGYIVCRYLIECRGYNPERAIEAFSRARGYPMERENYLEDLRIRKPQMYDNTSVVGRASHPYKRTAPSQRPRHHHSGSHPSQQRFWRQERSSMAPPYSRERDEQFGFDARYTFQEHDATRNYNPRRQAIRGRGRHNSYNNYSNRDNNVSGRRYDDQRLGRSFTHDNMRRHNPSYRDRPTPYSRRRTR